MKQRCLFFCVAIAILAVSASAVADAAVFDSDGVPIHYEVQGSGVPVVLIHGFSASPQLNWDNPGVTAALAKNFQVITIDNRGHGRSGKPHEADAYGLNMVEDVRRLLDHLGIERAHLVGYSMGAFITNKFLTLYPERCITAVLGGAGWARAGDGGDGMRSALAESLEAGNGFGPLFMALTPPGEAPPSKERIDMLNAVLGAQNDQKALAAVIRGMRAMEIDEEQLRANSVPTLALIGTKDPLKMGVDAMAGVMPYLDIVPIYGADHMDCAGRPQFIATLEAWLIEHSADVNSVAAAP